MRASALPTTTAGAAAAVASLLLAALAQAPGAAAAEYYQHSPRDGLGPLPIEQWYAKPIQGKSTYYGHYLGGGSCGLDQPDGSAIPKEIQNIDWTVALDRDQFFQGGCGMCIEIHGTGKGAGGNPVRGKYRAFVNNLCPECEYGHLDVAEQGDGLWDITWKAVPCDVGENNMRFVFMGSNDWYLKVGTQGTRYPTKRLRLKLDGQRWVDGSPVNGAYFEFRQGAPFRFPLEVEVTSVFGEVLTDWIQSIEGGPSHIQYRRNEEPTDAQLDAAEPGEEPQADDDIEQPESVPAPVPAPAPVSGAAPPTAPPTAQPTAQPKGLWDGMQQARDGADSESRGPPIYKGQPAESAENAATKYEQLSFAEPVGAWGRGRRHRHRDYDLDEEEEEGMEAAGPLLPSMEAQQAAEREEEEAARWENQYRALRGSRS